MWLFQNRNQNLIIIWTNGDIPGALPETCGFLKLNSELDNFGQMAIFRVLCQKHRPRTNLGLTRVRRASDALRTDALTFYFLNASKTSSFELNLFLHQTRLVHCDKKTNWFHLIEVKTCKYDEVLMKLDFSWSKFIVSNIFSRFFDVFTIFQWFFDALTRRFKV